MSTAEILNPLDRLEREMAPSSTLEPRRDPNQPGPDDIPTDGLLAHSHLIGGLWPPEDYFSYAPLLFWCPISAYPDLPALVGLDPAEPLPELNDSRALGKCVILGEAMPVYSGEGTLGYGYRPRPFYSKEEARKWTRLYGKSRRPIIEKVRAELTRAKEDAAREAYERGKLLERRQQEAEKRALESNPLYRLRQMEEKLRKMEEERLKEASERVIQLERRLKELEAQQQ